MFGGNGGHSRSDGASKELNLIRKSTQRITEQIISDRLISSIYIYIYSNADKLSHGKYLFRLYVFVFFFLSLFWLSVTVFFPVVSSKCRMSHSQSQSQTNATYKYLYKILRTSIRIEMNTQEISMEPRVRKN